MFLRPTQETNRSHVALASVYTYDTVSAHDLLKLALGKFSLPCIQHNTNLPKNCYFDIVLINGKCFCNTVFLLLLLSSLFVLYGTQLFLVYSEMLTLIATGCSIMHNKTFKSLYFSLRLVYTFFFLSNLLGNT